MRSNQLAPQRFRDDVQAARHAHSEAYHQRYVSPPNPRAEIARVRVLVRRAHALSDDRSRLAAVDRTFERATRELRERSIFASLAPGYVLHALGAVHLRPAFRVGDRTSRGVVESVREYSTSSGWLYGVRDERGVHDNVWESTLVYRAARLRR